MTRTRHTLLAALLAASALTLDGCASTGAAPAGGFTLSSPDLASGSFGNKFVLKAFGCTGENVSPALVWSGVPAGTKSLALQVHDPDAPTGAGFWHWAIYDMPAGTTSLSSLAVPVIAAASSALQLGERLRPVELGGMIAIGTALALVSWETARRRQVVDPAMGQD